MFDPTAFDNMKVIIEGALYDLDLAGEIIIIDRNDIMNLAKLSRSFDVHFQIREPKHSVTAKFKLESTLTNLAAELVPSSHPLNQAGCHIKLEFFHKGLTNVTDLEKIKLILMEIWGERKIIQSVTTFPETSMIKNKIELEFDRLINEEHMADLVEMIDFMLLTINNLQLYLDELNKA